MQLSKQHAKNAIITYIFSIHNLLRFTKRTF